MKDILERIAETSFRNDSWDDLRCRLLDCAEIIMNLRKDQSRVDWLASTDQSIGNVMLPTKCVEQELEGGLRGMIDCAMALKPNVK